MRRGRISDEGRAQSHPAILLDLGRPATNSGNVRGREQAEAGLRTHLTPVKRDWHCTELLTKASGMHLLNHGPVVLQSLAEVRCLPQDRERVKERKGNILPYAQKFWDVCCARKSTKGTGTGGPRT